MSTLRVISFCKRFCISVVNFELSVLIKTALIAMLQALIISCRTNRGNMTMRNPARELRILLLRSDLKPGSGSCTIILLPISREIKHFNIANKDIPKDYKKEKKRLYPLQHFNKNALHQQLLIFLDKKNKIMFKIKPSASMNRT